MEAFFLEAGSGKPVLFVGDGGGGDVHTVISSGMHCKPAPAGADFYNPIAGLQLEFLADPIVFGNRGFFKGAMFIFEYAAGIGHGLVEKQRIEIVAKIVMGEDVFPTAHLGIFPGQMIQLVKRSCQTCQAFFHLGKNRLVKGHDPHERGQIIRRPESFHIGLCRSDAAVEENAAVKPLVMNVKTGLQRCGSIFAKRNAGRDLQ